MAKVDGNLVPTDYISGEYAVGTECFSIVDESRKEVLGDGQGNRKIPIRMYYPVNKDAVEGKERAAIFTENKKQAIIKAFKIKEVNENDNYADYYEKVSVSGKEKFPLIIFNMGYGSYVEANTYLLCALASHGYIIASVGHAFEAIENDYEDGSFDLLDQNINKNLFTSKLGGIISQTKILKKKLTYIEALKEFDSFQDKYTPYLKERVAEWAKDIEKALEVVKERYGDVIDENCKIGASGHSLGGCLAYYMCRYNDEFGCGINIDGGVFGDYDDSTMKKPFCQISCKENINLETRPFVMSDADTYHVIFADMKHNGFTDAKFFIPLKLFVGKLEPEVMFEHLVYSHVTFFDKYLKKQKVEFDGIRADKVTYIKVV